MCTKIFSYLKTKFMEWKFLSLTHHNTQRYASSLYVIYLQNIYLVVIVECLIGKTLPLVYTYILQIHR